MRYAARHRAPVKEAARVAANWITGELFRLMKASSTEIEAVRVTPSGLAELIGLVEMGQVNLNSAKRVLGEMVESGRGTQEVVDALGLGQMSDADALASIVTKVIEANEDQVLKYRSGKESVLTGCSVR